MQRRIVSFANSAVAIEFDGERAARIVDFLFRDTPADETIAPHRIFRLMLNEPSTPLTLWLDGTLALASHSDATIADQLLGQVSFHLADVSRGGLVFHAGAVGWRGKTLVLPGGIGAGKTTLTAWLVSQGGNYLTDELVFVPNDADVLYAFVRPLSLKTRRVAQTFFDFDKNAEAILSGDNGDLISAQVLGQARWHSPQKIDCILFPRYRAGGAFEFARLSTAQTAFRLMECLINARNLDAHGLPQVARLAKLVPAFRLAYSQFEQIGQIVNSLPADIDGKGSL